MKKETGEEGKRNKRQLAVMPVKAIQTGSVSLSLLLFYVANFRPLDSLKEVVQPCVPLLSSGDRSRTRSLMPLQPYR
jgi:hypothetical protein